jgi:hypothetical protein
MIFHACFPLFFVLFFVAIDGTNISQECVRLFLSLSLTHIFLPKKVLRRKKNLDFRTKKINIFRKQIESI